VASFRNRISSLSQAGFSDEARWHLEISGRRLTPRLWRYADASSDLWLRAARDQGILGSIDHRYNSWMDDYDRLLVVDDRGSIARFLNARGANVELLIQPWRWREMDSEVSQRLTEAERLQERAKLLLNRAGLAEVNEVGLARLTLPADLPRGWWRASVGAASRGR
jgi:hypothetical protein